MHSFFKLLKETQEGDQWLGCAMIHDQPKQHRVSSCTGTVIAKEKGSIKLKLDYDPFQEDYPTEIIIRKFNVGEYGNDFRVMFSEGDFLTLFSIQKLYYFQQQYLILICEAMWKGNLKDCLLFY